MISLLIQNMLDIVEKLEQYTKLFLILCECVLACTCTQGLIKKLIFLVCVPSIAQLSTVMHCICIVHLAQYVLFVFGHKFKKKKKKTKKIFVFCISHLGFIIKDWSFYLYITCLCILFNFDELIFFALDQLKLCSACCVGKMFLVFITLS